jgi:hypothetical protein
MVQMTDTRAMLLDQLALVRGRDRSHVDAQLSEAGGDLEIDSKEGQTVAMRMELLLDMEGLIRPEDQTRTNLTTVRSLEQLIERRRVEREGK